MRSRWRARLARAAFMALCLIPAAGQTGALAGSSNDSGSLRYCDRPAQLSAAQQDKLLRLSGLIKAELDRSGARVALIARSGLNLGLFDMRYSHAGLSLQASPDTRWAVRQLYFACEERQPRLFDQGISAFLLGTDDPALGYISVVILPAQASAALEAVALDNAQALRLLGVTYSANAYAFSALYQNCNQWLIELLATAWGGATAAADPRGAAQAWLKASGYEAAVFQLPWRPLLWLTSFSPWLRRDDHPEADLDRSVFRVSMPASIEAFVRSQVSGAERVEFCHTDKHVVIRRGWEAIADGCVAGRWIRSLRWIEPLRPSLPRSAQPSCPLCCKRHICA